MGFLIIGAVFLFALVVGLPALLAIGASANAAGKAKQALASKDQILADLFDGSPQVTYTDNWSAGLPADVLVEGAGARGYRLTSTTKASALQTLYVFDKV